MAKVINITLPEDGGAKAYVVDKGQELKFVDFDVQTAKLEVIGNNLVIDTPQDGKILLLNFKEAIATGAHAPIVEFADGTRVSGENFMSVANTLQGSTESIADAAHATGQFCLPATETATTVAAAPAKTETAKTVANTTSSTRTTVSEQEASNTKIAVAENTSTKQAPSNSDSVFAIEPAAGPAAGGATGGGFYIPAIAVDQFSADDGISEVVSPIGFADDQIQFVEETIEDPRGGEPEGENSPPNAVNDAQTTNENTPVTITVLSNDTDPDGDALSVTSATNGANGTTSVLANGQIVYTPTNGFFGTDTFTYTISDGNGGTDTASVTVTVAQAPNNAPDAVNDAQTTNENTPVTITVLSNDTDPDGDALSVTSATNGANGTTSVLANGQIVYTPTNGFFGTDTFTYTISDGNGGTDTASVTVTVAPDPVVTPTPTDVIMVLDISTSMAFHINGTTNNRITAAVGSFWRVVQAYDKIDAETSFTVVTFDKTAGTQSFKLADYASKEALSDAVKQHLVNQLNNTNVNNTYFDSALEAAKSAIDALDPSTNKQLYFATDGTANDFHGVDDASFNWEAYAQNNGIESHVYTIDCAPNADTSKIDNTGAEEHILYPDQASITSFGVLQSGTTLLGTTGDDYIDGGVSFSNLLGGDGDDIIVFDEDYDTINGGRGHDTLEIADRARALNLSDLTINDIEEIDAENGEANNITLTAADIIRLSGDDRMIIKGDSSDSVTATEFTSRGANEVIEGKTYATFSAGGSSAALLVELGLDLNGTDIV